MLLVLLLLLQVLVLLGLLRLSESGRDVVEGGGARPFPLEVLLPPRPREELRCPPPLLPLPPLWLERPLSACGAPVPEPA